MRAVTIDPHNVQAALNEIQRASQENDIVQIAQNFSVDASYAQTATTLPALGTVPAISAATSIQTFQTGNTASTTEQTLASFTLPANTITAVNQGIKITAAGYFGGNGTEAIARLYFGTSVFEIINPASDHTRWYTEMTVICAATGPTQEFVTAWGSANFQVSPLGDDPSIDLTTSQTIKVTGQSPVAGAANEVVAYQLTVQPIGTVFDAAVATFLGHLASDADAFAAFLLMCQKGGPNRTT